MEEEEKPAAVTDQHKEEEIGNPQYIIKPKDKENDKFEKPLISKEIFEKNCGNP